MEHNGRANDPRVEALKWRDEILQLMYWMTGEGFGTSFGVTELRKFIEVEETLLTRVLAQMADDGLISTSEAGRYTLTSQGRLEGGRRFADEFEPLLRPGHFECNDPDCDCHDPSNLEAVCKHLHTPSDSPQSAS